MRGSLLFRKSLAKEEHVVVERINPIFPRVSTRADGEIVRDFGLEQRFVQIAIHLVEKVVGAIINDDVLPRLNRGHEVDNGMLMPALGVILIVT